MDVAFTTTENILEVLDRILEFTERRKEILSRNIFDCRSVGFIPRDLPSSEFAHCMTRALTEHVCRNRLLFCDTSHVRFESNGKFQTEPVMDEEALELLNKNQSQYMQSQIRKLSENLLNNRIAAELLRQIKSSPASDR
jgi:flagellar basal body rod protein FlgB